MRRGSNFLKKIDLVGVPVSLNFRGQDTYKTGLGGACSLVGIFITVFLTVSLLVGFWTEVEYSQNTLAKYLNFIADNEAYTISEDELLPSIKFRDTNEDKVQNISSYIQVYYMQTEVGSF